MFAKRLRQLRKKSCLSQYDLGQLLNITQQTINNYENGKREPSQDMLQRIADIFVISTDYLLGRTDDTTPPKPKKEKPSNEEYILNVKTLAEAAIRIADLFNNYLIDEDEYLRLNKLAVKKFPIKPIKPTRGALKAAHLKNNKPGTGVFED